MIRELSPSPSEIGVIARVGTSPPAASSLVATCYASYPATPTPWTPPYCGYERPWADANIIVATVVKRGYRLAVDGTMTYEFDLTAHGTRRPSGVAMIADIAAQVSALVDRTVQVAVGARPPSEVLSALPSRNRGAPRSCPVRTDLARSCCS